MALVASVACCRRDSSDLHAAFASSERIGGATMIGEPRVRSPSCVLALPTGFTRADAMQLL